MESEFDTSQEQQQQQKPPFYVQYNQIGPPLRAMECATEARFIESLFLIADDARDTYQTHIVRGIPNFPSFYSLIRFVNLKIDLYNESNTQSSNRNSDNSSNSGSISTCALPTTLTKDNKVMNQYGRSRSPWIQLINQPYRILTTITAIGKTSLRSQHQFITVPQSQVKRDFNDREQDKMYERLEPGDEPPRQFASVDGGQVFVKFETNEQGQGFFRPDPCPFKPYPVIGPKLAQMILEKGPEEVKERPKNAFKIKLRLRESDEDELGHVTNSRYAGLLYDVLFYGIQQGYYANGSGPFTTPEPLVKDATTTTTTTMLTTTTTTNTESRSGLRTESTNIAVPAGARFYKDANVHEVFVGYQHELKVRDGVYAWSWVEREKIHNGLDVIQIQVCSSNDGSEKIISLWRAIIGETSRPSKASL
ncbi:hypothetical protein BX616_001641 [Lobosporangium transversale]|uniref:Uncharacterized protein n=1 Tax=Lobosporangium transversale TaxID=64571 RepID=A0A1Y2GV90_9FUNG|nr:hypothetical protein BCR41DRAFT_420212 [Lobosporangium transversale]KAF9903410.1 hypothetical protein BX616_001641 [Lobosporangium transversale]ORZ24981.1 hypothetical protein BCR41DRAFT_420212 [Lobosporangium transversale]|eukprot:XP_021883962.1 hypothetical protein BCR41DRAFT_420212 [Lobosporangium transversale]